MVLYPAHHIKSSRSKQVGRSRHRRAENVVPVELENALERHIVVTVRRSVFRFFELRVYFFLFFFFICVKLLTDVLSCFHVFFFVRYLCVLLPLSTTVRYDHYQLSLFGSEFLVCFGGKTAENISEGYRF